MRKFKTRIEGTPAQIGQKYQERDVAYPYGTKRHASGTDLPAQTRSVDSMKSMSIPENQYQIQLSELNHTYLDGKIDQETYEKARTIMTDQWLSDHTVLTSEQAIGKALITSGYSAEKRVTWEEWEKYYIRQHGEEKGLAMLQEDRKDVIQQIELNIHPPVQVRTEEARGITEKQETTTKKGALWKVDLNTNDGFWYITDGKNRVKIGAVGAKKTNYYDKAVKEAEKRNGVYHQPSKAEVQEIMRQRAIAQGFPADENQRYNGWSNWDTWNTMLLLDNTEKSQRWLDAWGNNFDKKVKAGNFNPEEAEKVVDKYLVPTARGGKTYRWAVGEDFVPDPEIDPKKVNKAEIVAHIMMEHGEYEEPHKAGAPGNPGIMGAIGGAIGRGIVGAARTVGEASRAYQEGKSGKPRARAKQKPEAEEEESENPGNPGGEKWIQEAVEKPGSYRESVQRRYGKAGFTQEGRNQRISDR